MKITITLDTGNAAFDGIVGDEVGRIVGQLAEHISHGVVTVDRPNEVRLFDINGNAVGRLVVRKGGAR